MAGTTWPVLTAGKKAKASEVEEKFDWIEGTLVPMNAGSKTNSAYDLGESSNYWRYSYIRNGYFTPVANITAITIDQDYESDAISIDKEGAGLAIDITTKNGIRLVQDIVGGYGLNVQRNNAGTESFALAFIAEYNTASLIDVLQIRNDSSGDGIQLDQNGNGTSINIDSEALTSTVINIDGANTGARLISAINAGVQMSGSVAYFKQDAASSTASVLQIENDGTGFDLQTPAAGIKNGYIDAGSNEAIRWDVVNMTLDGTSPDTSTTYVIDESKVRILVCCGYDGVSSLFTSDRSLGTFTDVSLDGSTSTVVVNYGLGYGTNDSIFVFIGWVV
jgi:hypothetical protein